MRKPVEIRYGEGLTEPLTPEEARRRINAYAVRIPLERWAGPVASATELQASFDLERSQLDDWREQGAVISLLNNERELVFPLAQFVDCRPVEGVREVIQIVRNPRVMQIRQLRRGGVLGAPREWYWLRGAPFHGPARRDEDLHRRVKLPGETSGTTYQKAADALTGAAAC